MHLSNGRGGGAWKVSLCLPSLPRAVALGVVCTHRSCGALVACSAAIILHLKRVCFGGQETKLSVSSVRHQKAQLRRLPSRGACREIRVRAKPGLNQASVRSSSIGGGDVRSQATATTAAVAASRVCVSQGRRSDFWRGLLHFLPPAMLHWPTSFLIPRCDFNWLEGGAGRRKGCVCVF